MFLKRHGDEQTNDEPDLEFTRVFHLFYITYEKMNF